MNNSPIYRFEQCAYNNNVFISPLMCKTVNKIEQNLPINDCRKSILSMDFITRNINNKHSVCLSVDPSLNSNNYLYYRALQITHYKSLLVNLPNL